MTYIPRQLETTLERRLERKEILAIIGPRQAGKTTLAKHLLSRRENTHHITLDDIDTKTLFIENINAFIEQHIKPYDYIFIDEIQYVEHSGQKLKYIHDTQEAKLIISGSSAAEVSIASLQHLVGRVLIHHLYPLSLEEYLRYKDENTLNTLRQTSTYKGLHGTIKPLLEEYMRFGGYPAVVLEDDKEEKKNILRNIHNTYFLREIKDIFRLKEDHKLSRLLKALAYQEGSVTNYQELASLTGYTAEEVKQHISILNKTFICQETANFHTNKRNELKKSPKLFFTDTGFRNAVIDNFSTERVDAGAIRESLVAQELMKHGIRPKYWRTQSKAEVDFIIEQEGRTIPVEVKKKLTTTVLGKSLFSFINRYKPPTAIIISDDYEGTRELEHTTVTFIPLARIITIATFWQET